MSYFQPVFAFLFIPILVIIYNILPKKVRPILLLITSLGFFFVISNYLLIFLLCSIISIFFIGLKLNKIDIEKNKLLEKKEGEEKKEIKNTYKKKKKRILLIGILINVAMLFAFKYVNFVGTNANFFFDLFHINIHYSVLKYAAPIGISFYTLQALSYLIDIYNEKIKASHNILKVGLYLSFFPTIMEGPITRFNDVADSLYEGARVTYKNFCFGYQRIIYGFLKKIVIADRLNPVVGTIFDNYADYSGISVAFGVIAYTIMLYMEFSGTMDVVIGIGEMFNVKIPENFKQPFFAKNISEFWTRWHISLGAWFKDYIFYPISLSKPLKKLTVNARKHLGNRFGPLVSGAIALFVVWFLNGLWHGAGWPFLFFGMYHFLMILLGSIFEPTIEKVCTKLHINRKNIVYRIMQSVKMTLLIFIGELFFRAETVAKGFAMLGRIFTHFNPATLTNGELLELGIDIYDFAILFIFIIIIFIIGLIREKGHNIREELSQKHIIIRWIIYYLLIFGTLVFGAYGPGYEPVDPIYADF